MQNKEITGDSKYVAKYGHLAKYGSSLYMCYYGWDKKSENYKMYPLITYTSYISEITCISYTPDCLSFRILQS